MNYFDDMRFRLAARQFIMYDSKRTFIPGTNSLEFIRSGHVLLECGRKHPLELKSGTLFWMKKDGAYRFRLPRNNRQPNEHFYVDFYGERGDRILSFLEEVCPAGQVASCAPDKAVEIFNSLIYSYRSDPVANHMQMVIDTERLTAHIARSIDPPTPGTGDPHQILLAAENIREDPFREFNLQDYAAKAGISYGHFRRLFRSVFHLPPSDYRHNQQMILAAELLRTTDRRIKEIVYTCHFDSLASFSHAFKKYSGMSPREYRSHFRNGTLMQK